VCANCPPITRINRHTEAKAIMPLIDDLTDSVTTHTFQSITS